MMKKYIFNLLAGLIYAGCGFAQTPKMLVSDYVKPAADAVKALEAHQQEILENTKTESRAIRIQQLQYNYHSIFFNNQMMSSGQLIFNQQVDQLLEGIVENILSSNAVFFGTRNKVNISLIRSSAVNAFAADDGNVFVTLGLLSRVQNEAQLAYILCHELSHYYSRHGLVLVTNEARTAEGSSSIEILNNRAKGLDKHNYSQILELEADSIGFQLFLNTGYGVNQITKVFDVLDSAGSPVKGSPSNARIPFTNIPFDTAKTNRQRKNIKPWDVIGSTAKSVSTRYATHPSILERRVQIRRMVRRDSSVLDRKKRFQVLTPEQFNLIVRDAEFSLGEYLMDDMQFFSAYTHNGYLYQKYKLQHNKENMMRAWLGIVVLAGVKRQTSHSKYYTQVGQPATVQSFIKKATPKVSKATGLIASMSLYLEDSTNAVTKELLFTAFDVVRQENQHKAMEVSRFNRYTLQNLFDKKHKDDYVKMLDSIWLDLSDSRIDELMDEYRTIRQEVTAVNLVKEGILVMRPVSLRVDMSSLSTFDLVYDEQMKKHMVRVIDSCLSAMNVPHKIVSRSTQDRITPSEYEASYASNIILQQAALVDVDEGEHIYPLLLTSAEIDSLASQNDCRYIAYFGLTSVKSRTSEQTLKVAGRLYISYFTGFGAAMMMSRVYYDNSSLAFYSIVYDCKNKQVVVSDQNILRYTNKSYSSAELFTQYSLYQLFNKHAKK